MMMMLLFVAIGNENEKKIFQPLFSTTFLTLL